LAGLIGRQWSRDIFRWAGLPGGAHAAQMVTHFIVKKERPCFSGRALNNLPSIRVENP
jgi:hypothetical protein